MNRNWELEEKIAMAFGIDDPNGQPMELIDNICMALDVDTMNMVLETIAKDWDIEINED